MNMRDRLQMMNNPGDDPAVAPGPSVVRLRESAFELGRLPQVVVDSGGRPW